MRYLPLVWAGLWRKPARTAFTFASLVAAFLLFGLLQGIDSAFGSALQRQRLDRLLTDARFVGEPSLPRSYREQIERLPLVTNITWTLGIPGFYQDPKERVMLVATDPTRFFKVRDEYKTPEETLRRLMNTRTGLIVLEGLAEKHGWKVGDRVTFRSPVARREGGSDWTFEIVGFVRNSANPGQIGFGIVNYDYVDTARASGEGTVARFVVRITDPARSVEAANAIDKLFANSPAPTRTMTENELAQMQLASVGEVGRIVHVVIAAVFFSILFLTGNTVLRSVRERSSEIAVLKTLGFPDSGTLLLVLSEAALLCVSAAILGLLGAWVLFPALSAYMPSVSAYVGTAPMPMAALFAGLAYAVLLAVLSAALPAWRTMQLRIVDALLVR